jgi:hypothetical protein
VATTVSTSTRSRGITAVVIVGLVAAVISLGRLWLANHSALTEVVWAEDGVFPLCVEKAAFLTCLTDPFAGYLLVLPRLLAGLVALFPVAQWALVTNLLAALIAGLVSAGAFAVMRRFGTGRIVSVLVALLPVIAPIVGLEALNALGSTYMLLLYLATLIVAFPSPTRYAGWTATLLVGLLLLLTALTIPLAGILLLIIVVQAPRRVIALRTALIWIGAIAIGLIAQATTAAGAAKPREILIGTDTLTSWVSAVPNSVLTFWPGLSIGDFTLFDVFPITAVGVTGSLVIVAIAVVGVVGWIRGGDRRVGIAALLLSGLAYGFVPSVIGWANNRYFVVPCLLWAAAALVALDPWIRRTRAWVLGLIAVIIVVIWWPLIPASWFRATPAPTWSAEVARIEASCKADPGKSERIIFSPFWPPNWGDSLAEPTHPSISCLVARKWT